MIKKINYLLLIVISIQFFYSCEHKKETLQNSQWDYKNVTASGKRNIHEYIFCSIVGLKQTQEYKVGFWTFYSPEKVKIAEGSFDPKLVEIKDHGGCPYYIYNISIDDKKWKLWDSNGKPITTNKRDLDFILAF